MRQRLLIAGLILMALLRAGVLNSDGGYSTILVPTIWGNTEITWTVEDCPTVPFLLYFSGDGCWLAQVGSTMKWTIHNVGNDVSGTFTLGNASWDANDTEVSKDLTLGVWGHIPWLPGLVVSIGKQNLDELNETAHDSAQRVTGNYLNGTMSSYSQTVQAGGKPYSCLVFEYHQDETGFGAPQETYLAYDTATGLLVKANTSYSYLTSYKLVIELSSVYYPASAMPIIIVGVTMFVIVVAVAYIMKWR